MPSSDTVSHVLPKNSIVALTVPSHAASYSNRMFETDPIVTFGLVTMDRMKKIMKSTKIMKLRLKHRMFMNDQIRLVK